MYKIIITMLLFSALSFPQTYCAGDQVSLTHQNATHPVGAPYDDYLGVDFTYYLDDTNTLSVFLGSQKGGLVCANGTCVNQPDFINGIKFTGRILF